MKRFMFMFGLAILASAGPVLAENPREISAPELRKIVAAGNTISLKRVIDSVVRATKAEPLEARAFQAGPIFYRIVFKKQDGTLFSVIVNAETGEQVTKTSSIGKQVTAAAAAGSGAKSDRGNKGKSETAKSRSSAGESRSGGGNGNSGGNSGGGGGNSGGGNSGGGNGGGNGNGKN